MTGNSTKIDDVVALFKANAPNGGQPCFASYINEQLGQRRPLSAQWESKAAELDALIFNSKLQQPTTVYRATIAPYIAPHIHDGELVYPAFMSTSTEEMSVERHFSGPHRDAVAAILKIECPFLSCAFDMEQNPAHGGYEHELLLPRNSRFDVVKVSEASDSQAIAEVTGPYYAKSFNLLKTYILKYKI